MKAEFERYGLARFRILVGVLECLGALGLLVGYFNRPVLVLAAAGLMLTMLLGIATRIRIGDSLVRTLPAIGAIDPERICALGRHRVTGLRSLRRIITAAMLVNGASSTPPRASGWGPRSQAIRGRPSDSFNPE
jgi:hypothetical protein